MSMGKIQSVYKREWGGPSGTTWCQIPCKEAPKLCSLMHSTQEDLLVFIFKGKVDSLGGDVADDIGQVTIPEGQDSLLLGGTHHIVCNACIAYLWWFACWHATRAAAAWPTWLALPLSWWWPWSIHLPGSSWGKTQQHLSCWKERRGGVTAGLDS